MWLMSLQSGSSLSKRWESNVKKPRRQRHRLNLTSLVGQVRHRSNNLKTLTLVYYKSEGYSFSCYLTILLNSDKLVVLDILTLGNSNFGEPLYTLPPAVVNASL